mgnify:CR=1 FL=1
MRPDLRLLLIAALPGCQADKSIDSQGVDTPLVLAAFNVGTTPYLDALGESSHRSTCETWYDNNLCLDTAEASAASALERLSPDFTVLVEVWTPERCEDPDRPTVVDEAPYVCAQSGHQVNRLLPGHTFECAEDYPDLCIATAPGWSPRTQATGLPTDCQRAGRTTHQTFTTRWETVTVLAVHFQAGASGEDRDCRLEQIGAVDAFLTENPPRDDHALWMAGDFNFDVGLEGVEAVAWAEVADRHGLVRVPDDGDTSVLLGVDLDAAYVRGTPSLTHCTLLTADSDLEAPMFDHALLGCN